MFQLSVDNFITIYDGIPTSINPFVLHESAVYHLSSIITLPQLRYITTGYVLYGPFAASQKSILDKIII